MTGLKKGGQVKDAAWSGVSRTGSVIALQVKIVRRGSISGLIVRLATLTVLVFRYPWRAPARRIEDFAATGARMAAAQSRTPQ